MKHEINTNSLFHSTRIKAVLMVVVYTTFLMSLTTVAGSIDSTKKDSCCTTGSVAKAMHPTTVAPKAKSGNPVTNDPSAASETIALNLTLQLQAVNADADMNYQFMVANFPQAVPVPTSHCDALTDVQVQVAYLGNYFIKSMTVAAKNADSLLNDRFRNEYSLETNSFSHENVLKMLIASDKAINHHFAEQYGIVVVSSK